MAKRRTIPTDTVERQIAEIDQELARLQAKREALTSLLHQPDESGGASPKAKSPAQQTGTENGRSGPRTTDLIFSVVKEHPGLKVQEVAERVADQVVTRSDNPRRSAYNTALNLVRRQQLQKGEDGGLYPVNGKHAEPEETTA